MTEPTALAQADKGGSNAGACDHDIAATRAHIAAALTATTLQWLPFPHLHVAEVFPKCVYDDILRLNPFAQTAGSEWISRDAAKSLRSATPYWRRKQVALPGDLDDPGLALSAPFWRFLHAVFFDDDWFLNQLLDKLHPYFALRFGPLLQQPGLKPFLRSEHFLQQHEAGYFIGPHTDIPTRIVTCIFSFAERTGHEQLGTQLLIPKNPVARCSGRTHHTWDGFDLTETAPYTPNQLFLFLKTNHSFHAVAPFEATPPNGRFGMQIQLYEDNFGVFQDMSAMTSGETDPLFMTPATAETET